MQREKRSIVIVGAGAIGGSTAAFLADAGWDPELVCKHRETVDLAATRGLHVFGVKGEKFARVRAVKEISDLSRAADVVLLATKANDCTDAARKLLPVLRDDSVVVSLQNGICEDAIAEIVGRDRVVGCVVGWGATMHGPAELEVTSPGEFVVGNIDGRTDDRLPFLKELLDAAQPTRISGNIMGELYSKLIINSCINSLGVIAGLELGKLLAIAKVRRIFVGLMREAMAVAAASGIKVEPAAGGKLDFYRFLDGESLFSNLKRHLVVRMIGLKYRRIRSSSLQSLERGRLTEIDYLNGYVCSRAAQYGVPTPLNDAVVEVIKEIEARRRPITPDNLDDPVFRGW
ncbi:MAG: 2-dehydropantoate 2-reductase [Desulfomonile tiedjei]|nr:2-dehydropantoate 2-reductase [Desulfomonile tiedjei]